MALIYPKSKVEWRDSVLGGQINDENSKAARGGNLALSAQIDDKFGYITISTFKKVQGHTVLFIIFCLNLELISVLLNLSFVWC